VMKFVILKNGLGSGSQKQKGATNETN